MAFAVFLLLLGMLAAEIALLGIHSAGFVGAVLLIACAAVLMARRNQLTA